MFGCLARVRTSADVIALLAFPPPITVPALVTLPIPLSYGDSDAAAVIRAATSQFAYRERKELQSLIV